MIEPLKKELHMDFKEAKEHITSILKEEGFSVLLSKDIDEILINRLNIKEYPKFTMILACNPILAKMGLDVSPNVGSLYPCSFTLYEESGKLFVSHISIMRIAKEIGLADSVAMDQVIEKTSKIIHKAWDRL